MKRTLIASAIAITLGTAPIVVAGTAGLTGVWSGTYVFWMPSPGGAPNVPPFPPQEWVWNFDDGTININNVEPMFGSVWTAHDATFADNDDGTYGNARGTGIPNMLLDWSATDNIPIEALWEVTDNGDGTAIVDSVSSYIMPQSPAFPNFQPVFYGNLSQIPIPATVWLFSSGLLGLVGIARRKKA